MRFGSDHLHGRQPLLLFRSQGDANFADHGLGDHALQTQEITWLSLVSIGPKVPVLSCLDQLDCDSQTSARLQNRALHDCVDFQLVGYLRQWLGCVFVLHHRRPRDNPKSMDLGEVGNQSLSQSVREVVLSRIAREILQWQDSNRMDWRPSGQNVGLPFADCKPQKQNECQRHSDHQRQADGWPARNRGRRFSHRSLRWFRTCLMALYGGCDEPVTSARNGFDVGSSVGFVKYLSQGRDMNGQVGLFAKRVGPNRLHQLVFFYQAAEVLRQNGQDFGRFGSQRD